MGQPFTYISLGAGVQSSALLVLSNQGRIAQADVAIFADTGDEPLWVYEYLEVLRAYSDIPIERVSAGCISKDYLSRGRHASIPSFGKARNRKNKEAQLKRQCTREYKIAPIEKKVRELMGYQPRQRIKEQATAMIGISVDELQRAKPSRTRWVTTAFPLLDLRMRRHDCLDVIADAGLPAPQKSSCVFCPFHSDLFWLGLKTNHPEEFAKAVQFDEQIRNGENYKWDHPQFLHRTLQPLSQVEFDHNKDQISLWQNECEGYCGV